jgi:hypothetical protein
MAFFMRCWRSARLELFGLFFSAVLTLGLSGPAGAQTAEPEVTQLAVEQVGDAVLLNAAVRFELSEALEDALIKGVPLIFVAEADIVRERWYWTNKKVSSAARHLRLSYQPLTRRWRLTIGSGQGGTADLGMALNQSFDTLAAGLAAVQRISRWKIAETAAVEPGQKHRLYFSFRLDTTQLPRPLQIGTLGQSEWSMSVSASRPLGAEGGK